MPCWLSPEDQIFPDVNLALREPDGLLALGGDLSPERLLAAYRKGIFPWYNEGQPILWWSPDPRAVLFPSRVKISRSLRKTLRQGRYRITLDQAFRSVIEGCAAPRNGVPGTWISRAMMEAYTELHERGYAHSVEAWRDGQLVGGLYGVALGRVFFGESMFSRSPDASKVALASLARQLAVWG
ncbi:MAG: leucyl/phenylalanyl-tRNA--protein transferase, partial [Gammaproteobacteria bacterium]